MKQRTIETFVGAANLTTPHDCAGYADVLAVQLDGWDYAIVVPKDGAAFTGKGGERALGYHTRDGGVAQAFELRAGDRATRLRSDLPHRFCEWRIERSGTT